MSYLRYNSAMYLKYVLLITIMPVKDRRNNSIEFNTDDFKDILTKVTDHECFRLIYQNNVCSNSVFSYIFFYVKCYV